MLEPRAIPARIGKENKEYKESEEFKEQQRLAPSRRDFSVRSQRRFISRNFLRIRILELLELLVLLCLPQPQHGLHIIHAWIPPNDPTSCLDRSAGKGLSARCSVG